MSKAPGTHFLADNSTIAAPSALVRAGLETPPTAIVAAGARTSKCFIDFFTANLRNRNTRMAYADIIRLHHSRPSGGTA